MFTKTNTLNTLKTITGYAYGAYRTINGSKTYQLIMLPSDVASAATAAVGTTLTTKALGRYVPAASTINARPLRVEALATFNRIRTYRKAVGEGEGISCLLETYEQVTTEALSRINWDSKVFEGIPKDERAHVVLVASTAIGEQCVVARQYAKKADAIVSDWTGAAPSDRL